MPAPSSDSLARRGCSRSAARPPHRLGGAHRRGALSSSRRAPSTDCPYACVGLTCEQPRRASVAHASRGPVLRVAPWMRNITLLASKYVPTLIRTALSGPGRPGCMVSIPFGLHRGASHLGSCISRHLLISSNATASGTSSRVNVPLGVSIQARGT